MQSADGRADIRLTVNQKRNVLQLQPGASYKQAFFTSEERVKLYFFQVPTVLLRQPVRVSLQVTAITEDFYPLLLVQRTTPSGFVSDPA